jgi:hypothetical protein
MTIVIDTEDRIRIPMLVDGSTGCVRGLAERFGVSRAAIYELLKRDRALEAEMETAHDFCKIDGRWFRRLYGTDEWKPTCW